MAKNITKLFVKYGEPFNAIHEVIYPATKDTVIDNAKRFMLPIISFFEMDSEDITSIDDPEKLSCIHCDQSPTD